MAIVQKLGLRDGDDVLPEDAVRQDIRQVRPYLRLIQKGINPLTRKPNPQPLSKQTLREMEAVPSLGW
jgi:hypothetical protein